MGLVGERLEALVIARLETAGKKPIGPAGLVKSLRPFAPRELTDAQWRQTIDSVIEALRAAGTIDDRWRPEAGELARRIGRHAARAWKQLAERVLPALALGLGADDAKAHGRLAGRDGWAAAIIGRRLGVWQAGPPLSTSATMDAVVWRELGLAGTPKQCPDAVRAHFLHRHLGGELGPADRMMRMLAVQTVDAQRADLTALRVGLVRMWLAGRVVGGQAPHARGPDKYADAGERTVAAAAGAVPAPIATIAAQPSPVEPEAPPAHAALPAEPGPPPEPTAIPAAPPRSLVADVQAAADSAREGVFGRRKVFISAIWETLRATPAWASLELDDFKARLVAAHRRGELVLARADLVAAMDQALVDASETQTDGATFHFVVREPTP